MTKEVWASLGEMRKSPTDTKIRRSPSEGQIRRSPSEGYPGYQTLPKKKFLFWESLVPRVSEGQIRRSPLHFPPSMYNNSTDSAILHALPQKLRSPIKIGILGTRGLGNI